MRFAFDFRGIGVLQHGWLAALPVGLALMAPACSSDAGVGGVSVSPGGASNSAAGSNASPGSGGSGATAGAGTVSPGAGGSSAAGAAGTLANGGAPGGAGTTGTPGAGSTGMAGGNSTGADTPPLRPLKVDPTGAANKEIDFTAKQLDSMAGTSTPDTHAGDKEYAFVDTKKKLQGKLVMTLGGIGGCCGQGGIGGFAAGLGFHHLAIAMQTAVSSAPDQYKNVPEAMRTNEENRQMGDGRMEAWDGVDRVSWLNINQHDSFAYRAQVALKYLEQQDPASDWGYYLNADGSVRWSDVYLVGYSYGSQTLAVVSKYVRIGRGIATSGPEDEGFPNATWIHAPSATPLERMYGLFGSTNLGNKVMTTQAAGWLGEPLTVNAGAMAAAFSTAPHLMIVQGQGHGEFCAGDGGDWKAMCQYSFGVTP